MSHLKFVGVSSKHLRVFLESLRQSSEIFGHLRKFSENVRKRSSGLRNNFGESSEIFGTATSFPVSVFGCRILSSEAAISLVSPKNLDLSWLEGRYRPSSEILLFSSVNQN